MQKKPSDDDLRWMNITYANSDDPRGRSPYYRDIFGLIFFEGEWHYRHDIPTERQIIEDVEPPPEEEDDAPEIIIPPIPKYPLKKPVTTLNSAEYVYLAKRLATIEKQIKSPKRPRGEY